MINRQCDRARVLRKSRFPLKVQVVSQQQDHARAARGRTETKVTAVSHVTEMIAADWLSAINPQSSEKQIRESKKYLKFSTPSDNQTHFI